MVLPTAPTIYTVEQVLADPIGLNSRLGTYTNFVNLLDMCGLAVPACMRPDGIPFGITLLAPAGEDAALAAIGREFHHATGLPLGALKKSAAAAGADARRTGGAPWPIAVVGAHLSGMPLNSELRAAGGRLIERRATAPHYRLYALSGTKPAKPGLLRVKNGAGARSRWKSGRCRRAPSAASSPRCRRRSRSARSNSTDEPRGQRVSGRGRGGRGRARHFQLRRLARFYGAGKIAV